MTYFEELKEEVVRILEEEYNVISCECMYEEDIVIVKCEVMEYIRSWEVHHRVNTFYHISELRDRINARKWG